MEEKRTKLGLGWVVRPWRISPIPEHIVWKKEKGPICASPFKDNKVQFVLEYVEEEILEQTVQNNTPWISSARASHVTKHSKLSLRPCKKNKRDGNETETEAEEGETQRR